MRYRNTQRTDYSSGSPSDRDTGDEVMRLAQIYFVERNGTASNVIKVEPNEYGNIPSWPKGFFDEGPEEADLIIQAAALKRLAKQKRSTKQ